MPYDLLLLAKNEYHTHTAALRLDSIVVMWCTCSIINLYFSFILWNRLYYTYNIAECHLVDKRCKLHYMLAFQSRCIFVIIHLSVFFCVAKWKTIFLVINRHKTHNNTRYTMSFPIPNNMKLKKRHFTIAIIVHRVQSISAYFIGIICNTNC